MIYLANGTGEFNWWVLGIFLAAIGFVAFLNRGATKWLQARTRELPHLAARLGLEFKAAADADVALQWCMIDDALFRGDNRYAENILRGTINGFPVVAFDHHHEHRDADNDLHHYYDSVLIVTLPKGIKAVEVLPESLATTLSQPLGLTDINFESVAFSKAFCVRAQNQRAAYDVCNPQVMEYLLAHPQVRFRIKTDALFMITGLQAAAEIETNLHHLLEIRSRLPDYLFTKV